MQRGCKHFFYFLLGPSSRNIELSICSIQLNSNTLFYTIQCILDTIYRKSNEKTALLHFQSQVDVKYKHSLLKTMLNRAFKLSSSRPFARSGHMVRNKLCWDASYTVGPLKQRKVGLDWYEFLCFGSPTV